MIANLTLTRPSDAAGSHRAGAVKAERHRITCELHDAASQALFAANLLAGTLAGTAGIDEATRGQAQTLERLNRSALAALRMMLFELRPAALHSARLSDLLRHAVAALRGRGGIEVTTRLASEPGPRPWRSASRSTASPSRRCPTSAATAGPATCTWAGPCARPAAGGVLAIRSAPGEGTELLLQVNWN